MLCFRTLFIKKTNIYNYGCNFYTILVLQAHMLFHVLHITLQSPPKRFRKHILIICWIEYCTVNRYLVIPIKDIAHPVFSIVIRKSSYKSPTRGHVTIHIFCDRNVCHPKFIARNYQCSLVTVSKARKSTKSQSSKSGRLIKNMQGTNKGKGKLRM